MFILLNLIDSYKIKFEPKNEEPHSQWNCKVSSELSSDSIYHVNSRLSYETVRKLIFRLSYNYSLICQVDMREKNGNSENRFVLK